MRILHTADWHIGRLFHNVSLLDDQRHVLMQLLDIIEREQVELVLIAGDIYDRSVPPAPAVSLLDEVLDRICGELKVPVVMIAGNHDGADRLSFGSRQMSQAGLHIMADLSRIDQPLRLTGKDSEICVFGLPYHDPETVRDQFKEPVSTHDEAHRYLIDRVQAARPEGLPTVLLSHCFVAGGAHSESERPLSVGGAEQVSAEPLQDFDYVALGHLHGPQHHGGAHVRYSGSLLKYSFSESGHDKGVTVFDLDAHGARDIRHLPLQPLRDLRVLEGELDALIEAGRSDPRSEDYLLVRLTDRHALLDPMGRLRQVYPHVLHLEKTGLLRDADAPVAARNRRLDERQMFADFFQQVTGQPMTEAQQSAINEVIDQLRKEARHQ